MVRNNASFEVSVSEVPDNSGTSSLNNFWEVVGDNFSTNTRISLVPFESEVTLGELQYDAFTLDEPGTPRDQPAMILLEEGTELHGGGSTNFVGNYWGSVDTNHNWPEEFIGSDSLNRREMLFDPIDTTAAGSDPINLTFRITATPGDFETNNDTFQIWVDPDNAGAFQQIVIFADDSNSNFTSKFFNPDTGVDLDFIGILDPLTLNTVMQTVTVKLLPSMNNQLAARLKFRSWSSFTNELIAWDEVAVHTGSLSGAAPNGQLSLSGFPRPQGLPRCRGHFDQCYAARALAAASS